MDTPTIKALTAEQRGMELLGVPASKLPPVALAYRNHLCQRVGMCIEVCLSAFAGYAQVVEKLPLGEDDLYHAPASEIAIIERLLAESQA